VHHGTSQNSGVFPLRGQTSPLCPTECHTLRKSCRSSPFCMSCSAIRLPNSRAPHDAINTSHRWHLLLSAIQAQSSLVKSWDTLPGLLFPYSSPHRPCDETENQRFEHPFPPHHNTGTQQPPFQGYPSLSLCSHGPTSFQQMMDTTSLCLPMLVTQKTQKPSGIYIPERPSLNRCMWGEASPVYPMTTSICMVYHAPFFKKSKEPHLKE
jgi:hypothetical protein